MALLKCIECGKEYSDTAAACPNCGYSKKAANEKAMGLKPEGDRKNKNVAGILAIFFGLAGFHFFYLGCVGTGFVWLICVGISLGMLGYMGLLLMAFITLLQGICYFTVSSDKFNKKYNCIEKKKKQFGIAFWILIGILSFPIICHIIRAILN